MPDPILPAAAITEKLALRPTAVQRRRLEAMADAYRLARNWALGEWERRYLDWRTCRGCRHRATTAARKSAAAACPRCGGEWYGAGRPACNVLTALLAQLRGAGRLPDYLRTTADGGVLPAQTRNQAVADVEVAYRRWWDALGRGDKRIRRPRPHRRSARPGLYLHNQTFGVDGGAVCVAGGLGDVRLDQPVRYPSARVLSARVVRDASGRWYVCVVRELTRRRRVAPDVGVVGVDPGAKVAVTCSTGDEVDPVRVRDLRRLRRLQRRVSRRKGARKGERPSGRFRRARRAVARLHGRVSERRRNVLEVATSRLAGRARQVAVGDVRSSRIGRAGGRRKAGLNRAIAAAGIGRFRQRLAAKMAERGGVAVDVDERYTSQTCSACGAANRQMRDLRRRVMVCGSCGVETPRDVGAAVNIARRAVADGDASGPVATVPLGALAPGIGSAAGARTGRPSSRRNGRRDLRKSARTAGQPAGTVAAVAEASSPSGAPSRRLTIGRGASRRPVAVALAKCGRSPPRSGT